MSRVLCPPVKLISITVLMGAIAFCWLWIYRHFEHKSRGEEMGTNFVQTPAESKEITKETEPSLKEPTNRDVSMNHNVEVRSEPSSKQSGTNSFSGPPELKAWAVDASMRCANYINSVLKFNTNSSGISSISEENDYYYRLQIKNGNLEGTIASTDHLVSFWQGEFKSYSDKRFSQQRIATDRAFNRMLGEGPNYLTKESALELVYKTFRELGVDEKQSKELGKPRIFFPSFEKVPPIYEIHFPGYITNPQMFQARAEVLGSIPGGRITQLTIFDMKVLPNGLLKGGSN